jgi:predicted phage-related endonuclease
MNQQLQTNNNTSSGICQERIEKVIESWSCKNLGIYKDDNEEAWQEGRLKYIGGSEIGALMGDSSYDSPLTLYLKKTGVIPPFGGNDATRAGNELEEVVKDKIERDGLNFLNGGDEIGLAHGEDFILYRRLPMLQACNMAYLSANLDGYLEFSDEVADYGVFINGQKLQQKIGLEIKTFAFAGHTGFTATEVPKAYWWQCQAYMFATGLTQFLLVAYDKVKAKNSYYLINYDEDAGITLQIKCAWFFNEHINKQITPDPIGIDAETELLSDGLKMGCDLYLDEAELLVESYQAARKARLDYEKGLKELKAAELQAEAKVLEAVLKEQHRQGISENKAGKLWVKTGAWVIEKAVSSRTGVDTEALKKAGLYEEYSKTTVSESVKIKKVGKK